MQAYEVKLNSFNLGVIYIRVYAQSKEDAQKQALNQCARKGINATVSK
jgi:hypothetical protein